MGLNMYAYSVDQRVVEGQGDTDVPVFALARKFATGFEQKDTTEYSDAELAVYENDRVLAETTANEMDLVNPEFYYWRKFNHLHGWMEDLYHARGGKEESFNCCTLRLHEEDLDALLEAARSQNLEPRAGFFFGSPRLLDRDDVENIERFVSDAKDEIAKGRAVFYDSWY